MEVELLEEEIKKTHKQYKKYYDQWEQISDCIDGEKVIKSRGEKYLPYPVALGDIDRKSIEFQERYSIYLNGSHFVEYTPEAIDDLVASAFRKDPTINPEVPTDLEHFKWQSMSKDALATVVSYGNVIILVDYPTVDEPRLNEDKDNLAFMEIYDPVDVLDWSVSKRSGRERLTRVVLREESENGSVDSAYQYRELYLDNETGFYRGKLHYWEGGIKRIFEYEPIANGQRLDFIPVIFAGVTSNTPRLDKSPIIGISNTNIKHYQTTGELFWTQTYIGHPQMILTGLPAGWNKEAKKANISVKIDASQVLTLEGENTKAEMLEISGSNIIHFKTLEKLESYMNEQGYRLKTSQKSGVESATAMKIRHSGDVSKLGSVVTNIEEAMEQAFEWLGLFMGVKYTPDIEINKEFFPIEIDGSLIGSLSSAESAGTAPEGTTIDYLKEVEVLKTDEDTEALVEKLKEANPYVSEVPNGGFEIDA